MEPIEMTDFSNSMKEAGEKRMTRVSLIISVLAVCVALVTVLGHREHTNAVLTQSRLGQQWNQFQAHKIRSQEILTASDALILQPTGPNAGAIRAKLGQYQESLTRWQKMEDDESAKAKDFEAQVEQSEARAGRFDLSEALLEIGVVLASITLLTRHNRYAVVGVILGAAGAVVAASAYLLH